MKRVYKTPAQFKSHNLKKLKARAAARRQVLQAAGCSTYELGFRGKAAAIICLCCGLGSAHPADITELYCGFCSEFHKAPT